MAGSRAESDQPARFGCTCLMKAWRERAKMLLCVDEPKEPLDMSNSLFELRANFSISMNRKKICGKVKENGFIGKFLAIFIFKGIFRYLQWTLFTLLNVMSKYAECMKLELYHRFFWLEESFSRTYELRQNKFLKECNKLSESYRNLQFSTSMCKLQTYFLHS